MWCAVFHRHGEYGGAPLVWQRGAEEEMAGASAERRNPLLLLHDRYLHHNLSLLLMEKMSVCFMLQVSVEERNTAYPLWLVKL